MPQQHHADELLIDAEIDEAPAPTPAPVRPWLLLLGLVLVALNLRPALSSLAPLLNTVREHTGLSAAAAGLLTTLPVLCLGLFAPLAPRLARRLGAERAVLAILLLLAAGIVLRSLFPVAGLFLGSLVAGASIGIIGVLLPGIVKRDFPHIAGIMTGVYTMALCLGAALAAGASVPLAELFGDAWQPALAVAHAQEMSIIALTSQPPGASDEWRGLLQDTDIQIRVSHGREPRVVEAQRVLLHALADAVDLQLLGSDE